MLYIPSEIVIPSSSSNNGVHIVGCGIEKTERGLVCSQAGLLREQDGKTWISVHSRRYIPEAGDRVLGVVTGKMGEYFKIDIGSAHLALVHFLAFEGATKRNRPDLKNGDLLYGQVVKASRHMEATLTCVDGDSRARGMGKLPCAGLTFKAPLHLVRRLLSTNSQLLKLLGKQYKFEITCGVNGRIWLRTEVPKHVVVIRNIIIKSEGILESAIPDFVDSEVKRNLGSDVPQMEVAMES